MRLERCPTLLESAQQQVEVDETCVRRPARERAVKVVFELRTNEETAEAVERTNVSTWEDVQAAKPAEEDVVGAPAPDAAPPDQGLDNRRVLELLKLLELQLSGGRRVCELANRVGFGLAEADRA